MSAVGSSIPLATGSYAFLLSPSHDLECVRCVLRAARRTCGLTIEDLSSSDLPRTMDEILDLNQNLTTRLSEIFPDVPLVPSIGNNDVWRQVAFVYDRARQQAVLTCKVGCQWNRSGPTTSCALAQHT